MDTLSLGLGFIVTISIAFYILVKFQEAKTQH